MYALYIDIRSQADYNNVRRIQSNIKTFEFLKMCPLKKKKIKIAPIRTLSLFCHTFIHVDKILFKKIKIQCV